MEALLTVLHVDDDPDTRLLLRELLRQAEPGACFLEAGGAEEAVARHRGSQPDVILLDQRLGAADGLDLLPSLRRAWSCPVWIVTGFSPETLRERAEKAGAAGVIEKDGLLANATKARNLLLACCSPAVRNRPICRSKQ